MAITVAMLEAAGISNAQIVKVLKLEQAERNATIREQTRQRVQAWRERKHKQKQRARNDGNGYERYIDDAAVETKQQNGSGTEDATRARGSEFFLTSTSENITKSLRGSRLPKDWKLPDRWHTWALQQGLSNDEIAREALQFYDYWIARADKGATKLDWFATWRMWVRKYLSTPRRTPRPSRPQGSYATHFKELQKAAREREAKGWG
jgi:hypothetical protein